MFVPETPRDRRLPTVLKDEVSFEAILSADQLHMTDWGYACIAKLLGSAMAEAGSRISDASPHATTNSPETIFGRVPRGHRCLCL